jgi:CotH kinase protein/Lamin Tail Domain/Chitobiase/beta-hexosaminidase C-terminal domain
MVNAFVKTLTLTGLLLWAAVALETRCSAASVSVVFNEIMASNVQEAMDPQGQYDDWIELHNPTDAPVNVAGLYLTDNRAIPKKWQIPTDDTSLTTIEAGGFLLIWADEDTDQEGLHAGFGLDAAGEEVLLFDTDGATVIDSVEYNQQIPDISYGRFPDATGLWQPMGSPSPAAPNVKVYEGVVGAVKFSHDRGFCDAPFELTLTCDTPGATIYYTLDGSDTYSEARQVPGGRVYRGPILIFETTCIRARAFKVDWMSGQTETYTYVFLSEVPNQSSQPSGFPARWSNRSADYEMDPDIVEDPRYRDALKESLVSLPSMSLVLANEDLFDSSRGIYANPGNSGSNWERPGSIELFYPDGRKGFQSNCGVRIQGGYFRSPNAGSKKSFRLLFKGIYGTTKLRYPLFGDGAAETFDTVTLRAGANDGYTWRGNEQYGQFTRDQFARDLQNDTGQAGSHGMFVHLYVNGLYWGLYNPCERPDGSFSASYYGGDKEDWDSFKHKSFTVSQGDRNALNEMRSVCQEAAGSLEAYQRLQGNHPDGTDNPDSPHLLDVPNYIDYMIVNMWAGNWDWPWNNYWLARKRTADSTGFKFYCWDAEDIMLSSRSPLSIDKIRSPDSADVGQFHAALRQNPEYRQSFGDHLHRLFFNRGMLAPESLIARYQTMADSIEMAIIPELARWGDQNGRNVDQDDWFTMRDRILETYLPQRSDVVMQQFRTAGLYPSVAAPVFNIGGNYQHGGHTAAGAMLSMEQAPGTIWYTLDGSDPRVPEQGEAAGGDGGASVFVAENAAKRVLVPMEAVDEAWRTEPDFDDAAWIEGTGGVGYERSTGYEQYFDINLQSQMYGVHSGCYIRIPFDISEETLSTLSNLSLKVRYDDGFIAYLNGSEVARMNFNGEPAWDSAAVTQNSDLNAIDWEPFDVTAGIGQLHPGRNLLAIHALNVDTTSSDFLMSATLSIGQRVVAGGGAVSPGAIEYTGPVALTESVHVQARAVTGSSWSALNDAAYAVGPVAESLRISELMYRGAGDPNAEYIELTNIGSESINLNLVRFTNGVDFAFPSVELAPGGFVLVVRDVAAFESRYGEGLNVAGRYGGSLNNAGERIALEDAAGQVIHDFRFRDDWYGVTDGLDFSLTARDPAGTDAGAWDDKSSWRPSAEAGGSPGYDDAGQIVNIGAVVINELLANSEGDTSDWIELANTTAQTMDIGGWFLSDDAANLTKYELPAGTMIAPGGHLVIAADQAFGNDGADGSHEPFALSRQGETIYLHSGSDGVLTGYSEEEKFDASDPGVSLGRYRKSTGSYNFVALSAPTPGQANAEPRVGPVVISEIMYNPVAMAEAEYVELLNISDEPVTLYDAALDAPWRFTDDPDDPGIELLFPTEVPLTLAPGGRVVLTKNAIAFENSYAVAADAVVLEWGGGKLSNGGDKIQLSRPGEAAEDGSRSWRRVDRVVYSDGSHGEDFPGAVDPWPAEADGQGLALSRISSTAYGNDPANWRAAEPAPGRVAE